LARVLHAHELTREAMDEITILPEQAPVMPLPGALLFPHALLPLYIFEPRYGEMLDHALARERMFCVTLIKPDRLQWKSADDFFHVATIGLIPGLRGSRGRNFELNSARFATRPLQRFSPT
jgi:ATP-dependent Lon protease